MHYNALHEHCLACRMKDHSLQKVSEKELVKRKELLKDINIDSFNDNQKERIKLYLEGWTFEAIANKLNITRQAIEQSIKNIAKNDREVKRTQRRIAKVKKEIELLNAKIKKYQQKINLCQEELDMKQAYYNSLLEKAV